VATAHYLVRVMWALLKRGTTWEERVAPADEPKGVAPAIAVLYKCSNKKTVLRAGSNGRRAHRASEPEGGGHPPMPDEVGATPEEHPIGISSASCRRAGALIAAPCTPGQPLSVPSKDLFITTYAIIII